jgi:hypothetical protein
MGVFRAFQRWGWRRWIEQQLSESTLILDREANEVNFMGHVRHSGSYADSGSSS